MNVCDSLGLYGEIKCYCSCVIIRCAETERVPPANGVIVNAAAEPAGFLTVNTESITAVSTIAIPTICELPVQREDKLPCFGHAYLEQHLIYADICQSKGIGARPCNTGAAVRTVLRKAYVCTGGNGCGVVGRH